MVKVSVVIPTKNAGSLFRDTLDGLTTQKYEDNLELVVIDSGSRDDTVALASNYGAIVTSIHPAEFNHGLTRNRAIETASGEIVVLMSQDVIPGNSYLIRNFVTAFDDLKVAGAYARQVPREDADILTKRNLNTWLTGRKTEEVRWIKDWTVYRGLSVFERYYFCNFDNVCSAIRKSVWQAIPFTANEFGEDIDWAQKILEAGWKIAYWPKAYVIHSHNRSFKYEYDRSYLCHKKLYEQFGIHTVPSWKNVLFSTINSTKLDWKYTIQHEKQTGKMLKMLMGIPFMSFASVYGQYRGAKARKARSQQKNSGLGK